MDGLAADGGEGLGEAGELRLVLVGADDGTARAGELGRSAGCAGGHDHVAVGGGDVEDAVAQVEVGVDERGEFVLVPCEERVASLLGDVGEFAHRGEDVWLLFLEEHTELLVVGARDLGAERIIRDVEIGQKGGVEAFVAAVSSGLDQVLVEVHEDAALVGLDHAVLESALDVELVALRLKAERGCVFDWDGDAVELLKGLEHGRADGGGPGETDEAGNVRGVAHGEVLLGKGDAAIAAPEEEELGDGLHETDATIVSEELDVVEEFVRRGESCIVHVAWNESELGGLVHDDFGGEVPERERHRFAEVAVGGIAEKSGAGVGSGSDQH